MQSKENNVFMLYDNKDEIIGIIKFNLNEIIITKNEISEFNDLPLNTSNSYLFHEIEKYLNELGYFFEGDIKEVYFKMETFIDFKHKKKKGYAIVCILEGGSKTIENMNKENYSKRIEITYC